MNSLSGKRLLLMSGANSTCEIIREAKTLGIEVYATDYYQNTKAKKKADKSFMVSTADVPAIVKLCKEENIDGIFSAFTDSVLPYMQQVSELTGFSFWGDKDNIDICIDKMKFKEACSKSGIPVIPWIKINESNYKEIIKNVKCPVVVKPVDSSGSRGVYKCFEDSLLDSYCVKAFECSRKKELLIERLMNAEMEFSAYYILNNGESTMFAMGDRYVEVVSKDSAPKPKGMLFPSVHMDAFLTKIDPLFKSFFIKNNMNNGFVFIQGFTEDNSFYINEVGYRLNGGFTYKFNEYFNGYSLVEEMFNYCLTGKMSEDILNKTDPHFKGKGLLLTISVRQGVIGKIGGVEAIKDFPGVYDVIFDYEEGDEMKAPGEGVLILGYIHCIANNYKEIESILSFVSNHLIVENDKGENLLLDILRPSALKL